MGKKGMVRDLAFPCHEHKAVKLPIRTVSMKRPRYATISQTQQMHQYAADCFIDTVRIGVVVSSYGYTQASTPIRRNQYEGLQKQSAAYGVRIEEDEAFYSEDVFDGLRTGFCSYT